MALRLYNSLTKRDEDFVPLKGNEVGMYTCGPTVYSRPHVGNYSSFLMADLLRRWLEVGQGYTVRHVKNITDVGHLVHDADHGDDKIEREARKEKIDPLAIARRYTEQYLEDEKTLNLLEPAARPRATETIPEMLDMVKVLLENGHAYETDDGIYFDVTSFSAYGSLSGNTLENLDAGSRVEVKEAKKHPADFALWKKCVGENAQHSLRWSYESGERVEGSGEDAAVGFPGWHIECSAMSRKILGDTIDIHTGGEDNIFPHHECEIAQSECVTGKPFVRHWLHKRRIDLGDQKMSKSLGNVVSIPDILSWGFHAFDLRYYLLSVHYRTQLKFTERGLDDARKARRKICEWMVEVESAPDVTDQESLVKAEEFRATFADAMDNDLNTPAALASIFDAMAWSRTSKSLGACKEFAMLAAETFGCFDDAGQEEAIPAEVTTLIKERERARASKDFAESDRLRDEIARQGFDVRDLPEGQKVTKK